MAFYKCINCGETKESEKACFCSFCGYPMYEEPYEKSAVLRREIRKYLSGLTIKTVGKDQLTSPGLAEDQERFPAFDKVMHYVTSAERTEEFIRRLQHSIDEIVRHYQTPFEKEYQTFFDGINNALWERDEVLRRSLPLIDLARDDMPENVVFPKATLFYSETPNLYLWSSARELVVKIELLSDRILSFIRHNNLYGNSHRYQPKRVKIDTDAAGFDWKDVLEDALWKIDVLLKKKIIFDPLGDDEEKPLREMLEVLWNTLEVILTAPLLTQNYKYRVGDTICGEAEFFELLSVLLQTRYAAIDAFLQTEPFLPEKSEEALFDLYDGLLQNDPFDFFSPPGSKRIRIGESEKKLNELIGLSSIKESIKRIKAYTLANRGKSDLSLNMAFCGNPGSGKTEVARLIAGILYENKILPTDKMIEVDRSGLVSQYFGATAEKTRGVIARAMGGVLFVDEAYALGNNAGSSGITDYGKEAIDTLVKAMEDHRGKLCVIFAGYRNEMKKMLSVNPGMRSRIPFELDFPNYSREELKQIAQLMLKEREYVIGEAALERILDLTDVRRKDPNFANARELRNILDQAIMSQNLRCAGTEDREIGTVDVESFIRSSGMYVPTAAQNEKKILTGEEELDDLIGLDGVKRMVKKIKAYAKRNKDDLDFNLHMSFFGNPGTGKTEVARVLSRVLYEAGVLSEAKLVETDAQGLLGKFVGETGPKTLHKIEEAMGGVLFIDEAYALTAKQTLNGAANYGDEAVAVLLKEMEDRRGKFCVILAGYKDEMKKMLCANPGFESRIQFALDFPDYSREELGKIAKAFLAKKKYAIESDALDRVLDITDLFRDRPNFANARTVRNILDQVILNQNVRAEDDPDDRTLILSDVEGYLAEEDLFQDDHSGHGSIGF